MNDSEVFIVLKKIGFFKKLNLCSITFPFATAGTRRNMIFTGLKRRIITATILIAENGLTILMGKLPINIIFSRAFFILAFFRDNPLPFLPPL